MHCTRIHYQSSVEAEGAGVPWGTIPWMVEPFGGSQEVSLVTV